MLALRSTQPRSISFIGNATWPSPITGAIDSVRGYGARGTNATASENWIFENKTIYATRRSTGVRETVSTSRYAVRFNSQSSYCDALNNTPSDPVYSSNQTCYAYDGFFTIAGNPATTGAPTTAFGKTFPGSTGNIQQTDVAYAGIQVVSGQSYQIIVPAGGSITINWTE